MRDRRFHEAPWRVRQPRGHHKGCPYGGLGRVVDSWAAGLGTHKGCPYGGFLVARKCKIAPSNYEISYARTVFIGQKGGD